MNEADKVQTNKLIPKTQAGQTEEEKSVRDCDDLGYKESPDRNREQGGV